MLFLLITKQGRLCCPTKSVFTVYVVLKPNPSIVLHSDNNRSVRGLENAQNDMRWYDNVEDIETNQKL